MEFLSIFLIIYGVLVLYLVLTKSSLVFKNPKVKLFNKWFGMKGTYYLLLIIGLLALIAGILIQLTL